MAKDKNTNSLLNLNILHAIPGRVRIGCFGLKYLNEQHDSIYNKLKAIKGVKNVKLSVLTKNILINYDDKILQEFKILEITEKIIANFSLIIYKSYRADVNSVTVKERKLHDEPISTMVRNVLLIGATLGYSLVRRKFKSIPLPPSRSLMEKLLTPAALSTLFFAKPVFESGFGSIKKTGRPNADTLSSMAIITSLLAGQDISALTVMFLHESAELLTGYTMNRTRKAISGMLEVGDEKVWKEISAGKIEKVDIDEVEVGDIVVVHTGEKISVDGKIVHGEAVVDESSITGEFLPIIKKLDDHVFAGTIAKNGTIKIKAEKIGDDTAVSRIISMVEEANDHKAPIQTYADRFSAQLIPLNFLLGGIVFLATRNITRALNMLIIDYSCGIRLSTAAALSAAINTAAKNGILMKGSNYLELLSEADTLILDKTGTLTQGEPTVVSTITDDSVTDEELIALAAAAEETSTHPLGLAILDEVNFNGIKIPDHGEIKIHVARGVETDVSGSTIRVGNKRFMEENEISCDKFYDKIDLLSHNGETIIYISKDDKLIGLLGIQDPLRNNMKKAINRLRSYGIDDMVLLTGDLEHQAEIVANRMTMDRFESELLPEDKAQKILELQSNGSKVVMIGDGINDGPALAYADVGIAIGNTRTDIAMEAADITITSDNPMMIPAVYNLSKKTMDIVKQNFAAAIGINTVGLILGATGVLPVFWGAVLHNSSTILVVANSLRLLFEDIEKRR